MFISNKYQARRFRDPAAAEGSKDSAVGDNEDVKPDDDVSLDLKPKPKEDDAASKDDKGVAKKADDKASDTSNREAELLKESMQRKQALKDANAKIESLQSKVAEFDGIDLKEVRDLIQAKQDEETRKLEEKGQFDAVKEQMNQAHAAEVSTLQETINSLKDQINGRDSQIDNLSVGNAFGQSKFIAEKLTLPSSKARVLYSDHFERGDDGRIVGYDKPRGAKDRAPLVNASGDSLSFEDALQKIVDADPDKDSLYRSMAKAGAGSNTDPKAKATSAERKVDSGRDRIKAAIDSGGLTADKGLNLPT